MNRQLTLMGDSPEALERALEQLDNLSDDERQALQSRWPETLQSLSELLRVTLDAKGIKDSAKLADALATTLGTYLGGRHLYIPTGERLKAALRDIAIWRDFTGRNLEQLARQYGLTERRIAQILQAQRQAEKARRQRQLF